MTRAIKQPVAAPPDDPVRAALAESEVQRGLVRHAQSIVRRWLRGRHHAVQTDVATEAVQETQLRALQKGGDFDPGAATVQQWLHGILCNVLREKARSVKKQPEQASARPEAWECLASRIASLPAETVVDRLTAEDCLSRLSAEDRQLLRLRFTEDLGHDEIAPRLGITVGAARVRLCRALAAAKEVLGTNQGEER